MNHALQNLVFLGLAFLAGTTSCSREPEQRKPGKELDLITSAIHTVHQRYIDEQAVPVDLLISNSLLGMIEAIDPNATLVNLRLSAEQPNPPSADVPLIEITQLENPAILILRIFAFEPGLTRQLRDREPALRRIQPDAILLDVRGSYGQNYMAAAALAEWFLPLDSVIGALVEKQGEPPTPVASKRPPLWEGVPVVMLIDGKTTGPAEWAASALRFFDRVRLVGEPSAGQAMLMTTFPLSPEWGLRLSTGRALNPDGRSITGHPLTPDITAVPVPETENFDWIYQQGLTTLKGML